MRPGPLLLVVVAVAIAGCAAPTSNPAGPLPASHSPAVLASSTASRSIATLGSAISSPAAPAGSIAPAISTAHGSPAASDSDTATRSSTASGSSRDPGSNSGTHTMAPTLRAAAAAPDLQPVTFHGVTVQLPKTWKFHDTECGVPTHDTWTVPLAEPACGLSPIPDVTSVRFDELVSTDLTQPKGWNISRIILPGPTPVPAIRAAAPDGKSPYSVWISVPSRSASVLFTAHQQSTVDALVKSVTVVDQDVNRCPASALDVNTLTTGGQPKRIGADKMMVPVGVETIRGCRYVAGYLEHSTSVSGAAATTLATILNSAPTGFSVAPTDTYVKEICRNPKAAAGEVNNFTSSDAEAYRLEADYAASPSVIVVARLGWCGDLGESNGTRSGQRIPTVTKALVDFVGNGQGWPGSVSPAK